MDTTVVALLVGVFAGAFSGLFGSIAGPYLNYRIDERRRQQIRKEERQRDRRQMLEAMMRLARTQCSGLIEYELTASLGRSMEEARLRHLHYVQDVQAKYPFFFWRPSRIEDDRLRELAKRLQNANSQATMLLGDVTFGFEQVGPEWNQRANEAREEIESLLEDIDRRLDESEW